jgi:hypothetical protein
LKIGLLLNSRKVRQGDQQSAAGYQHVTNVPYICGEAALCRLGTSYRGGTGVGI